ncbi:MAG: hypothetical protein Q4A01_04010 [Coriobacteriales bacterium]|nr:hypothetical protein [Coriobacteriales bacterium]
MRQRAWCVLALVALVLATLSLVPARALASEGLATVDARVRVFQIYDVSTSGLQNTFDYLVIPQEDDAPLPVEKDGQTLSSFTLTRDEEDWLTIPITVGASPEARSYTYHYELRPKQTTLPDGLFYVDVLSTDLSRGINVYYLEIFVQESNENPADAFVQPLVHVEGWDGPKVSDPGWRVGYQKGEEGSEEGSGEKEPSSDNESNKDQNGTPTSATQAKTDNTGGASSSGSVTSSGSGTAASTSLSRTGDVIEATIIVFLVCAAAGAWMLGVLMRRWRAGDRHA